MNTQKKIEREECEDIFTCRNQCRCCDRVVITWMFIAYQSIEDQRFHCFFSSSKFNKQTYKVITRTSREISNNTNALRLIITCSRLLNLLVEINELSYECKRNIFLLVLLLTSHLLITHLAATTKRTD